MTLTNHLLARLKDRGLHVEGPWQEGKSGYELWKDMVIHFDPREAQKR